MTKLVYLFYLKLSLTLVLLQSGRTIIFQYERKYKGAEKNINLLLKSPQSPQKQRKVVINTKVSK